MFGRRSIFFNNKRSNSLSILLNHLILNAVYNVSFKSVVNTFLLRDHFVSFIIVVSRSSYLTSSIKPCQPTINPKSVKNRDLVNFLN